MAEGSDRYLRIFSLAFKQAWLGEYVAEVDRLFQECDSNDQIDLISDLLHRFTYFGNEQEEGAVTEIADRIIGLGLPASTMQVVAMSADDDADSGQAVLYALKGQFARRRFSDVQLVNTFAKAQRYVDERPNVVLVDEFVGTGRTLKGRISTLIRDFKNNKKVENAKLYVFAYAGMRKALDSILQDGLCEVVHFVSILDRGISDMHADVDAGLLAMDALEQKLLENVDGVIMPGRGDGQCEALYGRRGGNCPNSVFPIFWWPMSSDNKSRLPLLVRKLP